MSLTSHNHEAGLVNSWSLGQPLLGDDFPLSLSQPFSRGQANAAGVTDRQLHGLVAVGLLRRVIRGVYVAAQAPDTALLRAQALGLVVPPGAVVTDWTACWLWTGIDAPGAHLRSPELYMFHRRPHARLRNHIVISGARRLLVRDTTLMHGITATTPLRTACDLGRLFRPDRALGGMDALARTCGVKSEDVVLEAGRFRGMRWVTRLRRLAPMVDPRAESPGESGLRYWWLEDTSLPPPTPQIPMVVAGVEIFRVDLGVPELLYGCEYDGLDWHGPERGEHDESRREELRTRFGWVVDAVGRDQVFGSHHDVQRILHAGIRRCRDRIAQPHRALGPG